MEQGNTILARREINPRRRQWETPGTQAGKFFDDARGSAIECAACLDASVAKGFVVLQRIQSGKAMLVRIVAMLTKLLERFDPEQFRVRESSSDPLVPFEHEHDDEHEHD